MKQHASFAVNFAAAFALLASVQPASLYAQAPDNTKMNQSASPTADNQKNNKTDRQITATIRKSVVGDKSLSTYAHNIKIITRNGNVTLEGPVRSDEEKSAIQKYATDAAGGGQVTNNLTVKPPKNS